MSHISRKIFIRLLFITDLLYGVRCGDIAARQKLSVSQMYTVCFSFYF